MVARASIAGALPQVAEAGTGAGIGARRRPRIHARRPFFAMADLEENARRRATGKKAIALSPIAIEVVRRIDALFDIERPINGTSAEARRTVRQERSQPLVEELRVLHARAARQTLSRPRPRQGHRLYPQALGGLHPVPR
jgi:hypothetical protein